MADLKMTHTLKYVTDYSVMPALRREGEFLVLVPDDNSVSITGLSDLRRGVPLKEYASDNEVSIVEIMPAKTGSRDLFIVIFQKASFEGVIATVSDSGMEEEYADMLAGTLASAISLVASSTERIPANGEMSYSVEVRSDENDGHLSYGQVLAVLMNLAIAR